MVTSTTRLNNSFPAERGPPTSNEIFLTPPEWCPQRGLHLGTPFITLLYPFQVNDEGVKTTILGNTIFFPLIYLLTKKRNISSPK